MNRLPNKMLAVAACLGLASICAPAQATTYTFSQTGFADGGAVSGYFTGRDLNADGAPRKTSTRPPLVNLHRSESAPSRLR